MELTRLLFVCSFSAIWLILVAQADEYLFVPEDDRIFRACPSPDDKFFSSVDLSTVDFTIYDETIQIEGYMTFLWELEPTDNIEIKAEAYRRRGVNYQPTVLNIIKKDGCQAFFNKDEVWYDVFTTFVDNKICPTEEPNLIWYFTTFNVSATVDLNGDEEGKYKIVVNLKVYDENNQYKKERFCGEMVGDLYRMDG